MAYEVPQEMPKDMDEVDLWIAKGHQSGIELGKRNLRKDIKEFMMREFFASKKNERRANPDDPQVQAVRAISERMFNAFEDGTL